MTSTDEQKQQLLDRLKIGVSYQLLLLFVEQAFILEKEESITALSDLFEQFIESLSEEQKKEFGKKMMLMLDQRAEAVEQKLEEQLHPQDLESVKEELQQLVANDRR